MLAVTDKSQPPLVIYHANCNDGMAAAWAAHANTRGGLELMPAQYGDEPPDVTDRTVYVLDFSYNRTQTERMYEQATHLVVLDHETSHERALAGLDYCHFDHSMSGALAAWRLFAPHLEPPTALYYVDDYDRWEHRLPKTRAVNAYLRSLTFQMPQALEQWDAAVRAIDDDFGTVVAHGTTVCGYEDKMARRIALSARRVDIAGFNVPSVQSAVLINEVAHILCVDEPFALVYHDTADGRRKYSLRSEEGGEDVSRVAEQFGGGGREHTAGFHQPLGPWRV